MIEMHEDVVRPQDDDDVENMEMVDSQSHELGGNYEEEEQFERTHRLNQSGIW